MNVKLFQIASLGLALVSVPAVSRAQTEPMGPPLPAGTTQPNQQRMPNMQDSTATPGMSPQMMNDKMFLRKAAAGGMAEVQFGQLAAQKASSEDVKNFGLKMVTDHTSLNEDMKPIADNMGVRLPMKLEKKDEAEYQRLKALSGDEFDKAYITDMVNDHHKDLKEFREEAASATDPTLKDAVTRGVNIIKEHTMMIDKIAQEKGIQVPDHKATDSPAP
jgi:putative membrane protein